MNNMNISITARNDGKVARIILMMLANMDFEKVCVKRYEGIGVEVKIDETIINNDVYMEVLDVMRNLRKLDGLWNDRIEVQVVADVWGNEYRWGYFYDYSYDGNIFDEWGKIDIERNEE